MNNKSKAGAKLYYISELFLSVKYKKEVLMPNVIFFVKWSEKKVSRITTLNIIIN